MIGGILKFFFGAPDERADGRMPLVDRVIVVDNKFIKETGVANVVYPYKQQDEQVKTIGEQLGQVYKIDPMVKKKMPTDQVGILSSLLNFDYNYTINFYKQSLEVGFKQLYYTSRIYEINLGMYTMMYSKYAKEIQLIKEQLEINEWQLEANVKPFFKKTIWAPLIDMAVKAVGGMMGNKGIRTFNARKFMDKGATSNPYGILGNNEMTFGALLGHLFPVTLQYYNDGTDRSRLGDGINPMFSGSVITKLDDVTNKQVLDINAMKNRAIDYSGFKMKKVSKEYRKALKNYIKENKDNIANMLPSEYQDEQKRIFRETVINNMRNTGRWTNVFGIKSIDQLTMNELPIFRDNELEDIVNNAFEKGNYKGLNADDNYEYLLKNIKKEVNKETARKLGFEDKYTSSLKISKMLSTMDKRVKLYLEEATPEEKRDYFNMSDDDKLRFANMSEDEYLEYLSADDNGKREILNNVTITDNIVNGDKVIKDAKDAVESETINTKVINTELIKVYGKNSDINNGVSVQSITGASNSPTTSSTTESNSSTNDDENDEDIVTYVANLIPKWEDYKKEYRDLYKDVPKKNRKSFIQFINDKVRIGREDEKEVINNNQGKIRRAAELYEKEIDAAQEGKTDDDVKEVIGDDTPKPDKNGKIDYTGAVTKWLTRGSKFALGMGALFLLPKVMEFLGNNKDSVDKVTETLANITGGSANGIIGLLENTAKGIMGIYGLVGAIGKKFGIEDGFIANAALFGSAWLGIKYGSRVVGATKGAATSAIGAINSLRNGTISPGNVAKSLGKGALSGALRVGGGALKLVAGSWRGKLLGLAGAGYAYNQLFQQSNNPQSPDNIKPTSDIEIKNPSKESKIPTYTGNKEYDEILYDMDQIKAGNNAMMAASVVGKGVYNKIMKSPNMSAANTACGKGGFLYKIKVLKRYLSSTLTKVGVKPVITAIGKTIASIASKLIPVVGWASALFSAGLFVKYYFVDGKGFWWSIIASLVTQEVADIIINFFGGEDNMDAFVNGEKPLTEKDIEGIKKSSEKLNKDTTTYNSNIDKKTGETIDNTTGKKVLSIGNLVSATKSLNDNQKELINIKANKIVDTYNAIGGRTFLSMDDTFVKNVVSKSDLVIKMFEASEEYLRDGEAITLFVEKSAKKPKTSIELRKRILGKLIAASYKYTGNKYKLAIESSMETRNKKEPDALEVLKNEIFGGSRKNIDETSTSDNSGILANWSVSSSAVLPDTSSNVKPGLSNPGYDTPTTIINETKNNNTSPTTEATNAINESMTSSTVYTDPELLNGVVNVNDTLTSQSTKQAESVEIQKRQLVALEKLNITMSNIKVNGTYNNQPSTLDSKTTSDDTTITDDIINSYQDGSASIVSTPHSSSNYVVTWISMNGNVNERRFNSGENATKFYNELKTKGIEKSFSNSKNSTTKVNIDRTISMRR